MQAERWKKVEELYHAAMAVPLEQRAAFLNEACSDDARLRSEVQSLLDQPTGGFLEGSLLSQSFRQGARLGSFEMVERIGRGGMGEVWRARDTRLKRDVAIKLLPPAFSRDPERIARFEYEARAASALNHPNVVSVFDIGNENGVYWIVSELVDGESLHRLMGKGPMPVSKVIDIAAQVAEGLAAAHAAGIMHRDLKPGNIMVRRDGRVKIVDFGLAKRVRPGPESDTITGAGVVLGTVGYMSPEQVRGDPADHRSDLFSFGVVLYEMLSGRRAFSGDSSIEVLNSILKDDPPDLPASVPSTLNRIVRRCLEKDPARRFQSAADLGFALESSSPSLPQVAAPQRRVRWKWAALLVAFATAGVAYWLAVRPPTPPAPAQTTLRRLTNDPGLTTGAAISPDGKLVAYVRNDDIWVQQVDGSGLLRITDDPAGDSDPTFSPDGTQIAFRSERAGGGIYTAPVIGGEARQLVPQGRQPRFSPDGRRLMYWTGPLNDGDLRWRNSGLFVQPISGGGATQVGAGCGIAGTGIWSPDGSRILFLGECGNDVPTAWVSALDGKDLKSNRDVPGVPVDQWISDPPRLLIHQRLGDATYIVAMPVSADGTRVTGPSQRLTSFTDNVTHLSAAWNGRMAFSVSGVVSHIWGLPIDGRGQATGEPKQITYGSAGEREPFLSRDGRKVAFVSQRPNGLRLFYKDLATGQERNLSADGYGFWSPVFSPDGTEIMCAHSPFLGTEPLSFSGPPFIYRVPLSGDLPKKIWDKSFVDFLWDWAPDGKTLLFFTRDDPSKPLKGMVRQLDLDSLSTTMFLDDPEFALWQAHFSHDGRWVTFNATTNGTSHIYVAPFRKALVPRSEWIAITDGKWDDKPRFSYDDRQIFFMSSLGDLDGQVGRFRFWAQRLKADMRPDGKPVAVYPSEKSQRSPAFAGDEIGVGPKLVVFYHEQATGNICLLEPAKSSRQ